jgi:uncharacterized phage protein (TIGR02216 family)
MRLGLGALRYPPDVFWRLTLPEFFAAVDGLLESKGVKRGRVRDAPTREEVDALFAQLDSEGRLKP